MSGKGRTGEAAQVPEDTPQPTNWAQLYEKCHEQVRRYLAKRVRCPHDVEDLVQDVFTSLIAHGPVRRPEFYVYAVTRHRLYSYWQREGLAVQRTVPFYGDQSPAGQGCCDHASDPANQLARREMRQTVVSMVKHLPPALAQALRLRFMDDLPPREAAVRAGCSRETLKKRLSYGRRSLVQLCRNRGVTPFSVADATWGMPIGG